MRLLCYTTLIESWSKKMFEKWKESRAKDKEVDKIIREVYEREWTNAIEGLIDKVGYVPSTEEQGRYFWDVWMIKHKKRIDKELEEKCGAIWYPELSHLFKPS
jgi:hypothetical protein